MLDIDSPGGSVFGITELAKEIFEARKRKRVLAVANSSAASAAFWLARQAHEVIVTPSGEVGSIGVIAMHLDQSGADAKAGLKPTFITAGRLKAEGNPREPLGVEARADIRARVDEIHSTMVSESARGRGVNPSRVRFGIGEGRIVGAKVALRLGLADRIATLSQVVFSARARRRRG